MKRACRAVMRHAFEGIGVHRIELKLKEGVPAAITLKIAPENFEETEAAEQAKSDTE